jgi:hypothetical protein
MNVSFALGSFHEMGAKHANPIHSSPIRSCNVIHEKQTDPLSVQSSILNNPSSLNFTQTVYRYCITPIDIVACNSYIQTVSSPFAMFSRAVTKSVPRTRLVSTSVPRRADFTHAIVGAGAVGLAIARKLQSRDGASSVLIEKHGAVGTETSSRNSEV